MAITKKDSPTAKQRKFLERQRIPVPPTKQQCSLLISYILDKEKQYPDEEVAQRIRRMRDYWPGAEVSFRLGRTKHCGRVIGIRMRPESEIAVLKEKTPLQPGPFELIVEYSSGTRVIAPSCLKVRTPGDQKRLF